MFVMSILKFPYCRFIIFLCFLFFASKCICAEQGELRFVLLRILGLLLYFPSSRLNSHIPLKCGYSPTKLRCITEYVSSGAIDFHLGDTHFKSWPGHWLSWQRFFSSWFCLCAPAKCQDNSLIWWHQLPFTNPFQFVFHQPSAVWNSDRF